MMRKLALHYSLFRVKFIEMVRTKRYLIHRGFVLSFKLLARELGVAATQVTKSDKAEHIKRNRHRPPQTSTGNVAHQPTETAPL
jgi:hypothetical protein